MFSLPGGHAGKQQVSSVQKGEFGLKCLVAKQDGRDALSYDRSSELFPKFQTRIPEF